MNKRDKNYYCLSYKGMTITDLKSSFAIHFGVDIDDYEDSNVVSGMVEVDYLKYGLDKQKGKYTHKSKYGKSRRCKSWAIGENFIGGIKLGVTYYDDAAGEMKHGYKMDFNKDTLIFMPGIKCILVGVHKNIHLMHNSGEFKMSFGTYSVAYCKPTCDKIILNGRTIETEDYTGIPYCRQYFSGGSGFRDMRLYSGDNLKAGKNPPTIPTALLMFKVKDCWTPSKSDKIKHEPNMFYLGTARMDVSLYVDDDRDELVENHNGEYEIFSIGQKLKNGSADKFTPINSDFNDSYIIFYVPKIKLLMVVLKGDTDKSIFSAIKKWENETTVFIDEYLEFDVKNMSGTYKSLVNDSVTDTMDIKRHLFPSEAELERMQAVLENTESNIVKEVYKCPTFDREIWAIFDKLWDNYNSRECYMSEPVVSAPDISQYFLRHFYSCGSNNVDLNTIEENEQEVLAALKKSGRSLWFIIPSMHLFVRVYSKDTVDDVIMANEWNQRDELLFIINGIKISLVPNLGQHVFAMDKLSYYLKARDAKQYDIYYRNISDDIPTVMERVKRIKNLQPLANTPAPWRGIAEKHVKESVVIVERPSHDGRRHIEEICTFYTEEDESLDIVKISCDYPDVCRTETRIDQHLYKVVYVKGKQGQVTVYDEQYYKWLMGL